MKGHVPIGPWRAFLIEAVETWGSQSAAAKWLGITERSVARSIAGQEDARISTIDKALTNIERPDLFDELTSGWAP